MIREFLILSTFLTTTVLAGPSKEDVRLSNHLSSLIHTSLTEKIAGATIRIPSLVKLLAQKPMSDFMEITGARLVSDKPNGIAVFDLIGTDENQREITQTIQTPYEAWKKVPVASHRIYPNAVLKNEDFKVVEVNVAKNPAREYRGVMAAADTIFAGQQSKQTILEGQFVVDSAIQRQPDIRKGDLVKLELISGDLTLTTQAVTEESGSICGQIRVTTSKTKREITGRIKENRTVEVNL